MQFKQTSSDPCLYIHYNEEETFIIAVCVDDIILEGRSELKLKAVKRELSERFEMKDLGQLYHLLRVKIVQDQFTGLILIGQPSYTEKVLHQFGMNECKPVSTPANSKIKPASACLQDVCN